MNSEKYLFLNEILMSFNVEFGVFLSSFSDKTNYSIKNSEETYVLEISAINDQTQKKVIWSYRHILNYDNELFNRILVIFENNKLGEIKRKSFNLEEYLKFRKVTIDLKDWIIHTSYEEEAARIKSVFKKILSILQAEEMHRILFTDAWIEVPIDWSPYK